MGESFAVKILSRTLCQAALCLCVGCTEQEQKRIESTPEEWLKTNEVDAVCRRIADLNVQVVTIGEGISPAMINLMRAIADRYRVNIPEDAFIRNTTKNAVFIDTKEKRLAHFLKATQSDFRFIWCMRGGFGTNMLIDDLNRMPIPEVKKTLIGFCDITSMHLFVHQKWGWRAIHAPLFVFLAKTLFSRDKFSTLLNILEGKIDHYELRNVQPLNEVARRASQVTGPLTGGNLTVVEASLGTCWEIETEDRIVFLEDVHTYPQWIYRSMYHLKESGKLSKIKALLFGEFIQPENSYQDVVSYLRKFAETLVDVPVYVTNQFGHGRCCMPLIYGAPAQIHAGKMTVWVK
ncbi:MAG: LD-carboxypeptidase [Holosporaceae bacterium]|nr:LD-carboxypeptidase [Holosporaceae bacterium]